MKTPSLIFKFAAGVFAALALHTSVLQAQTLTWIGTDGATWGTTTNWSPSGIPDALGESAQFHTTGGSPSGSYSVDLNGVDYTFGDSNSSLYFRTASGDMTINGGGSLTVNPSNSATTNAAINNRVDNQIWNIDVAVTLRNTNAGANSTDGSAFGINAQDDGVATYFNAAVTAETSFRSLAATGGATPSENRFNGGVLLSGNTIGMVVDGPGATRFSSTISSGVGDTGNYVQINSGAKLATQAGASLDSSVETLIIRGEFDQFGASNVVNTDVVGGAGGLYDLNTNDSTANGSLDLQDAAAGSWTFTLDFDNGDRAMAFANSSSLSWDTDATLDLTGFVFGFDTLRFGIDSSGLTSAQLGQITVDGSPVVGGLTLDSSGYLSVIPEPSSAALLLGSLAALALLRRRR